MSTKKTNRPTVRLIGHAHIDPVWLWRWQEGYAEVRATFRSALDRMKETPGYIFTCSSAALYEWVEKADPAMFREIRKRVTEGRWAPAGGYWIEPDCNLPCGESFVRQGLYGQRYFKEKFGRACRIAFVPDSFGHAGTLPKLVAGCGLEGYVFMRPMQHENPGIPPLAFRWRGDDGTELTAFRVHTSYNALTNEMLKRLLDETVALAEKTPLADDVFVFFGVGNHGGGPTRAMLRQIGAWQKQKNMPKLMYASFDDVLDAVDTGRLPVWSGEMQHHARGCYSAVSAVKTGMRRAERSLIRAELWSSAARTAVRRQPDTAGLGRAWKHVLFNQFHDILAGSSTAEAYDDAGHQLGAAMQTADTESNAAQQAICARIDTRGEGAPLVLFNHLPAPFRGVVETDDLGFLLKDEKVGVPGMVAGNGGAAPAQSITTNTLCGRRRFVIHASIPPLGYVVLHQAQVPARTANRLLGKRAVRVRGNAMENEFLRAGVDRRGYLTLYDRKRRRQVFSGAGAIPLVMEDPSDTWSHDVPSFRKKIGRFKRSGVRVLEAGPVRACLEADYTWDDSRLRLQFLLGAGEPHLLIRGRIDWRQSFQLVKLAFPVPFTPSSWSSAAPYGSTEREVNGQEEAIQEWADVSVKGRGVALANDSKYGCSCEPDGLRLTILRSPPYAFHDPFTTDDFSRYAFTDQGPQNFSLAVLPHAGDWRQAGLIDLSAQLNNPPTSLAEFSHAGSLPRTYGFARCRGKGVRIEAIKAAEEGRGLIVRAVEWYGRKRTATFELPAAGRAWTASFRPHEVKSFFVPDTGRSKVREVNLLEEPA